MVNILGALVPLYMYPAGCAQYGALSSQCAWKPFFTAIEANKMYNWTIVINPASGPGAYPPSTDWITVVNQVNSYNNTRTVGYVDSWFGTIPESYYKNNITTFAKWATYTGADIHMDGIFVDDVDLSNATLQTYYKKWLTNINTLMPAGSEKYSVLNPGAPVADCTFFSSIITGSIITFEGFYSDWLNANAFFRQSPYNQPNGACTGSKQTHIIHDFNGTAAIQQQRTDDLGETYRVGNAYITNNIQDDNANPPINPYDKVPPLLAQFGSSVTATDTWIVQHPQWYSRMRKRL